MLCHSVARRAKEEATFDSTCTGGRLSNSHSSCIRGRRSSRVHDLGPSRKLIGILGSFSTSGNKGRNLLLHGRVPVRQEVVSNHGSAYHHFFTWVLGFGF